MGVCIDGTILQITAGVEFKFEEMLKLLPETLEAMSSGKSILRSMVA
jgi:hypothetical protein